jgi:hypothetical protein
MIPKMKNEYLGAIKQLIFLKSICAPPQRPVLRPLEEATPISPRQQEICSRVKAVFNY